MGSQFLVFDFQFLTIKTQFMFREASVPAGESRINLTFNDDEIHQVVSTLIVDDPAGGVKSVTFSKPNYSQRRLIGEENKGFEQLLLELRGARIKCTFENKEVSSNVQLVGFFFLLISS